jgi:hypothetical protein
VLSSTVSESASEVCRNYLNSDRELQYPEHPHTAAVNIWALGMVALQLLAPSDGIDVNGLSHMYQHTIDEIVTASFSGCRPKPSNEGMQFV